MPGFASLFVNDHPDDGRESAPQSKLNYGLLLVDDEINVLKALRRVFRDENYDIVLAQNADEALKALAKRPFHVVISDYKMPGMNGAELLRRIKNAHPEVIRIMLTGHADTGAVMGAVNEGAVYKFIIKPWNDDDLRVTVALALEQFDLIQRNRKLQHENTRKNQEIKNLSRIAITNRSQLAIMLHKRGLLTDQQVQQLHTLQNRRKEPPLKLLLEKGWVDEKVIRRILRDDLMVEEVSLTEFQVDRALLELVPHSFCERQMVVPLKLNGRRLLLAVADPMDEGMIDDLRFVTGLEVQVVMADVAAIKAKIQTLFGVDEGTVDFADLENLVTGDDPFESVEIVIEDDDEATLEELLHGTEEPPAIRLVNAIIIEAVRLRVSDIHIQPRTKGVVVRYRIDGVLQDKIHIPHALQMPLVSRIKVMAEMDITERRRPQDGRITVKTPMRIVDLRISTLPTVTGEKVVMRVLDRNSSVYAIDELGFSPNDRDRIAHMISRPQGLILATGPTGSGKTTTLYSLLQHDASPTKNYVTIEDPVEYFLDMAGQVHVREKIGLDFPTVLRAILRQDPDVILLGEIRDFETAEVAFHAALTGHMVFSTLHTNSAVATIARLFDLGLKPYVIASALEGIVAQRLVRRVCAHCREEVEPDPEVLRRLGGPFTTKAPRAYRGTGCNACNFNGYRGRVGLYEILVPSGEMRGMIAGAASLLELDRMAAELGMGSLLDDAYHKVNAGVTTADEVLRVLGAREWGQ